MDYWQEQSIWASACEISPDWAPAIDALKQRTLHLRAHGHACEGLELTVNARRWADSVRMTIAERGLLPSYLNRRGERREISQLTLSRQMLEGMHPATEPIAQQLWARLVVDGLFGFGDSIAAAMEGDPDRSCEIGEALTCFGPVTLASWCAMGLHFELASAWTCKSLTEVTVFLERLDARYEEGLVNPLAWTGEPGVLSKAGILDLAIPGLADDRPSFVELLAHQAPQIDMSQLQETPAYRRLEAFWDGFLGRSWLTRGAWLIGQVTRDMLNDPEAICRPWDYDKKAHELTQRLAKAKKKARLPAAAPRHVPRTEMPPSWPVATPQMRCLFAGPAFVTFGWLMLQSDSETHAGFDSFNGQQNGLVGALLPGVLTLNTGLHTGDVHVAVWQADAAPDMPADSWEEVVEVSLVLPTPVDDGQPHLENLEADFWKPLDLAPGTYRARVAVARYGATDDDSDESNDTASEPMERYALVVWPDTEWRPDAVLRERHPHLIAHHRRAQASGF